MIDLSCCDKLGGLDHVSGFFYSVNTRGWTDRALPVSGNGADPLQRVIVTEDLTNKVIASTQLRPTLKRIDLSHPLVAS